MASGVHAVVLIENKIAKDFVSALLSNSALHRSSFRIKATFFGRIIKKQRTTYEF